MENKYKKKIVITGGSGLLGSYFYKKYKKKYSIKKYPYRIQNFKQFDKWVSNKKVNFFIHFAALTRKDSENNKKKLNLINVKSTKNILRL